MERSQTLRVLLVEDNPADVELVKEILQEESVQKPFLPSFELHSQSTLEAACQDLKQQPFDVVLLDLHLQDSRGLPTFQAIQNCAPDTPVIILTGLDGEDMGVKAVSCGAQDFLHKGYELESGILGHTLYYAWERRRSERKPRPNEGTLRAFLDSQDTPIAVLTAAGGLLHATPLYQSLFSAREQGGSEDVFPFPIHFDRPLEVELPDKDGSRFLELNFSRVSWEGEEAVLALFSDITRHQRSFSALETILLRSGYLSPSEVGTGGTDQKRRKE